MIDTTDQPHDPQSQPYIEPVIAPPPPAPKPPTLASMIVEEQRDTNERLMLLDEDMWFSLHDLLTRIASVQVWVIVAIGVASLSVLLNIAVLAILAALLGHAR